MGCGNLLECIGIFRLCAWELIGRLKKLGVWDKTVLVVSGDHGEELFEDGFLGHGHIIKSIQYRTFFVTSRPGYGSTAPSV